MESNENDGNERSANLLTRSTRPLCQDQKLAWIRTLAAASAGD